MARAAESATCKECGLIAAESCEQKIENERNSIVFITPRVFRIGLLISSFFVSALPASADPIFATIENRCVSYVPNAEVFWWSTAHFRFASFWSLESGCQPTVDIPTTMYERFDNFDGTGGLAIRVTSDMLYPCGRGQWDAGDTWYLMVDMGIDCADYTPPAPPPIVLPPIDPYVPPDLLMPAVEFAPGDTVNTSSGTVNGSSLTPEIEPPVITETTPTITSVPEPATLILLAGGLLGLAWRRRVQRRKRAEEDEL